MLPAKASSGPAAILGGPDSSGRMFNSKGEPSVPAVYPGTAASATGAPAIGLKLAMRRVSRGEKVRPLCPTKGRVNIGERPGRAGSAGRYPSRVPVKFSGNSGTRLNTKRPWASDSPEDKLNGTPSRATRTPGTGVP